MVCCSELINETTGHMQWHLIKTKKILILCGVFPHTLQLKTVVRCPACVDVESEVPQVHGLLQARCSPLDLDT